MSRQPTRQLSLQQPPKRTQVRRQRSADDNRLHGSNIYHSDQPVKARRDKSTWGSMERPKVRIAWSSQMEDSPKVEVIASRIGTTSASKSGRTPFTTSSVIVADKAAILYSRQELAERLRLAWKQREANKSNIDIFLAHDTTAEERCDSRLSTSSCADPKGQDDVLYENGSSELENCAPDHHAERVKSNKGSSTGGDKDVKVNAAADARTKRASFQSGTNVAFNGPVSKSTLVSPAIRDMKERGVMDARAKRTNSAPPLQRRGPLSNSGNLPGPSTRPRVNIIIDTPKMSKPRELNTPLPCFKFERKESMNQGKCSAMTSPHNDEAKNTSIPSIISTQQDKHKSTGGGNKKRARSGKRRVEETGRKSELSKANPDVVTMVSLVSDADSDSEVEKNSPRDDKLVRQLRSHLSTTPIIKTCSPMMMGTGNFDNCGSNGLIPRRVIKSVSFQQDTIDGELHIRPRSTDRNSFSPDMGPKMMLPQHQQPPQLLRCPGDETRTAWQEITCTNLDIPSSPSSQKYWNDTIEITQSLTEREKRCLVVPIGDPQDKKRKLLLQRTKSVPARTDCSEERCSSAVQMETRDSASSGRAEGREQGECGSATGTTGVSLQSSISKIIDGDGFRISSSVDIVTVDHVNIGDVEPLLRTTKEKECWHLYRRMCDKGVCVSFDTVLRGMLTPTEYRLRKRQPT